VFQKYYHGSGPWGRDIRPEKPLYQAELAVMVKGGVVIAVFGAAGIECGEPGRQRRRPLSFGLLLPQRNVNSGTAVAAGRLAAA
jgi:hypothetical protein